MSKEKKRIVKLIVFILAIIGFALCALWCTNAGFALEQLYANEYAAQIAAFGVYNEHIVVLNQVAQMHSCLAQLVVSLVFGVLFFIYIMAYIIELLY